MAQDPRCVEPGAESPLINETAVDAMPTVAHLLEQSRAQIRLRAILANRGTKTQPSPDYLGATTAAQIALDARLQAHQRDPEHTDPAWALDHPAEHDGLVAFLQEYISAP